MYSARARAMRRRARGRAIARRRHVTAAFDDLAT
jgi:hypothetical protein